jgi:hypothetical protein
MSEDEVRRWSRTPLQLLLDPVLRPLRRQGHSQIEQGQSRRNRFCVWTIAYVFTTPIDGRSGPGTRGMPIVKGPERVGGLRHAYRT